jgi:hypothetical protein
VRVFISSTCYDLIDLRAELEVFFREAGVTPIMSDSLTSEFQTSPNRNSIETCLTNLRSCDAFLIILSNRYGPSLKIAEYGDFSATHLEYLEAVKGGKAIYMYVRDRLEADYGIWKANRGKEDLELVWCKDSTDWKLFDLVKEHRKLSEDKTKNNWIWVFHDSLDLKQRVMLDFKDIFARAQADRLFENGRVPFLEITAEYRSHHQGCVNFDLHIRNLSSAVAVNPRLHLDSAASDRLLKSLLGQEKVTLSVPWANNHGSNLILDVLLTYSILEGHTFSDQGKLTISYFPNGKLVQVPSIVYELKQRRYVGRQVLMAPAP